MDQMQQSVLYAFHPDRILTFEEVARISRRMLPFVRNTINTVFVKDRLVEEVFIGAVPGTHFKLTIKGIEEVRNIHNKRVALENRINELRASGVRSTEAAKIAAMEAIETDISVP